MAWRLLACSLLLFASSAWALEEDQVMVLQNGSVADGNGTEFVVKRYATVAVDVTISSGTATVNFETRADTGAAYTAVRCQRLSSGAIATTATATGNYVCPVAAQANFRARISDCSSCVVSAIGKASTAPWGPLVSGAGGGGDASLAEQQTQTTHLAAIETAVEGTLTVSCSAGCSGGTQYNQGTASTATDALTMAGAIRRDTAALDAGVIDGDRAALSTDSAGRLRVTAADTTQPVSVASLPLPTGAATSANQTTIIGHVDGVEGLLTTIDADTGNIATNTSNTSSGVGATGDAAATAGSTGSLSAKLRLITSQLDSILTELGQKTEPANTQTVSGTVTANLGTLNGAATAANQSTANTALSAIQTAVELIDNDQTGASVHYRTSAGTTEDEHEVKGSAGRLFSITATNTNASARYLRCANQVIGSTTPGTTTVFLGLAIPGATTGAGFTATFGPAGIAFSTGLTCWLVTGAADTDVAEVAANEIKVIYVYK